MKVKIAIAVVSSLALGALGIGGAFLYKHLTASKKGLEESSEAQNLKEKTNSKIENNGSKNSSQSRIRNTRRSEKSKSRPLRKVTKRTRLKGINRFIPIL